MRVIAGSRRGRRLIALEGDAVRPTTDRIKENVFNLVAGQVPGAQVLDLFAGTGALAIEALSRGAASAVLCDNAERSLGVARRNLEATGFAEAARVVKADAISYLKRGPGLFDLIFLDPPYGKGLGKAALREIVRCGALREGGLIVLETDAAEPEPVVAGLSCIKSRIYGKTRVSVWAAASADFPTYAPSSDASLEGRP